MKSDFIIALTQLAAERNLPREIVFSAIEAALVSAYRKDSITAGQNISVKLDPGTGDVSVRIVKTIVDEITDPQTEITLTNALKINPDAEIGDTVATDNIPHSAGRIAAQTAKQVVMQRLREAERDLVYEEFAEKEGDVFSVTIQRIEPRQIIVELGRAEAVMPISEQIQTERYRVGTRLKILLQAVIRSSKGPEIIVSRTDSLLMRRLFEMEVPEIYSGAVEIMGIAREAGSRSKVAVRATQDGIDPVGSCVGLRGIRIQNIVNELQGEKIDVIEWSKDPGILVANALSPSKVMRVELISEAETARAVVPERQLSLAIGKDGQNARLAAKLTGWKVDIRSNVEADTINAPTEIIASQASDLEVKLSEEVQEQIEEVLEAVAEPVESELPIQIVEEFAIGTTAEKNDGIEETTLVPEHAEQPASETPFEEEKLIVQEVESLEADLVEPDELDVVAVNEITQTSQPQPVASSQPQPVASSQPQPVASSQPPVPVLDRSTSLRDLPEDVWSIRRRSVPSETGRIRFAEDISGLRGGRSVPEVGNEQRPPRKTKAGKKRRKG